MYKIYLFVSKAFYKLIIMQVIKCQFPKCNKNIYIGKGSTFTYSNIFIGNNVSIGANSTFMSTNAKIIIGNNVMFGPHVFLISGDHRIDVVGKYMIDIKNSE